VPAPQGLHHDGEELDRLPLTVTEVLGHLVTVSPLCTHRGSIQPVTSSQHPHRVDPGLVTLLRQTLLQQLDLVLVKGVADSMLSACNGTLRSQLPISVDQAHQPHHLSLQLHSIPHNLLHDVTGGSQGSNAGSRGVGLHPPHPKPSHGDRYGGLGLDPLMVLQGDTQLPLQGLPDSRVEPQDEEDWEGTIEFGFSDNKFDKNVEDYFLPFEDECTKLHNCAGRVAGVLSNVRDKVIAPPSYDSRNIVELIDKYGDAHLSDSGWREVDPEEWFADT